MTLLIRADASVAIGTGHVMRCLALAQAWQDTGGSVVFTMRESTPSIRSRLSAESVQVEEISSAVGTEKDAGDTVALAQRLGAKWIAVDGYQFDGDYQRALKAARFKLLFLDDYGHAGQYFADVVLNQNLSVTAEFYEQRATHTRFLLGPRYSLLRREFSGWTKWQRRIEPIARRMLVLMGGSDPENVTGRVIQALQLEGFDLEVTVVAGGSNPHVSNLREYSSRSRGRIRVISDAANVPELMAEAELAVSAAGSTSWELCCLGLPSLLIDVAPNQTAVAKALEREGCAVHLGSAKVSVDRIAAEVRRLCASQELRHNLSTRSRQLVDGNGARRIVSELQNSERIRLRPALTEDAKILWEWANDPEVRAASFSADPISWEGHLSWLDKKLTIDKNYMWIAETVEGEPVGQIRFEARSHNDWEVGISIAKTARGRGCARALIRLGVSALREHDPDARAHALIKPSNVASLKAFEKSGFKVRGTEIVGGQAAIHLVKECANSHPVG